MMMTGCDPRACPRAGCKRKRELLLSVYQRLTPH